MKGSKGLGMSPVFLDCKSREMAVPSSEAEHGESRSGRDTW